MDPAHGDFPQKLVSSGRSFTSDPAPDFVALIGVTRTASWKDCLVLKAPCVTWSSVWIQQTFIHFYFPEKCYFFCATANERAHSSDVIVL